MDESKPLPSMRMILRRSTLNGSAMQITHLYPFCYGPIDTARHVIQSVLNPRFLS